MSETNEPDDDDLRARFPDPETDGRLRTPRGDALPESPKVTFRRPTFQRADQSEKGGIGRSAGNLRAMGIASTIGISLVASIGVGTGLGWMADTFLLHSTGTPWGLIVGFLLGVASGFVNLVRVANRLNRDGDG